MVLAMLAATVYGVFQVFALTSPTRTIRLRTALLAIAVGVYACGVLALALELASVHAIVAMSELEMPDAVRRASYTIDPVLEELVKVVPLSPSL